eukprot:5386524-Amphidinium_carterae.1
MATEWTTYLLIGSSYGVSKVPLHLSDGNSAENTTQDCALDAGVPMPDPPSKMEREEVLECLRLISKAWPVFQIHLKDSSQGLSSFGTPSSLTKVRKGVASK